MKAASGNSQVPVIDRVHQALASLGLAEMDALVEARLERAAQTEQAYGAFLAELLESEVVARRERYLRTRMRLAHLPAVKTLEQFDLAFQPSLDARQIRELQTLRFVSEASNVVLLGPPGVGKLRPRHYLHRNDVRPRAVSNDRRSPSPALRSGAPAPPRH